MTDGARPSRVTGGGIPFVPLGCAVLKLLLHLPVLSRYGYHHDELYFIACGRHLDVGYVDHAPLVPWIARLATVLFGESLAGLRIFATLAGAAAVLLVGLLARRLGGGRFAQLLACLAMLVAPVFLRTGNLFCIPAFEPLFWLGASYLVLVLVDRDDPRLWLGVGLIAGAGLLNKHSMLFFGFGLALGILATPLRRHLRTPWPWLGAAAAILVFLPNLVWQIAHGWPTLHFLLDLNRGTMAGIAALQFVAGQLLYLNPAAAWVWIAGIVFYFSAAGRRYRVLGWIWVAVFLLLLLAKSKIYYLAPAYPALLAAGGVASERWLARRGGTWLRAAAVALLVAGGLVFAPVSVPALSIEATDRYITAVTFGAFENVYELTGDLHGMFGWPERVAAVARAYRALPPPVRETVVIWAAGYGTAGAIDHLGRAHGLPRATSLANSYWLWGPPKHASDTVLTAGFDAETLARIFEEVEILERVELEHVDPGNRQFIVAACRKPRRSLAEIWARNRPW
jgi:hypothetical protein